MKAKKLFYLLYGFLFLMLFFVSTYSHAQPHSLRKSRNIPLDISKNIIARMINAGDQYMVPQAWIFERDTIDTLLKKGPAGIRFYSSIIGVDTINNIDTLTLIGIGVNGSSRDQIALMYEYSDMCPPSCNYGFQGTVTGKFSSALLGVKVPYSWFVKKKYFDDIFISSDIKYVKLYGIASNGYLHLRIVGAKKEIIGGKAYYIDVVEVVYPAPVTEPCDASGGNCDTSSELYKVH